MTREQALRKVLACLRLSRSSNPNEAAAGLRQAKALMAKFGLSEDDAVAAEIRDAEVTTRSRGAMVPQSVLALANLVADGYRCKPVISCKRHYDFEAGRMSGRTTISFFGANADAEVATYAFTVLNRQLQSSKTAHTKRIRKRANKARRGEEFALGWTSAVAKLFPKDELSAERNSAIERAIRLRVGETEKTTGREIGKAGRSNPDDRWLGYAAGANAQLHDGIAGDSQRRLSSNQE
ncbi:DUF2786 domain-containing protein [Luteimonas terricola]|uniref:DUF2786 domain-containing protein n=1 Tax=Luteimonas terricola TaxID=645597 RepID=A0ABQ2EE80_9GAMM|nr:DUF2786 domain-containing protein [Luteimonas terricola]GGK08854.1 hypothetical protein GCM10011394_17870 [Luteimonas terricola]